MVPRRWTRWGRAWRTTSVYQGRTAPRAPSGKRGNPGLSGKSGGGGGIRTHGTLAGTTVFETVPIDHSGTPPLGLVAKRADNRGNPGPVKRAGRPDPTPYTPTPSHA